MRLRHVFFACAALLVAGCGKVERGQNGGGTDHRDASSGNSDDGGEAVADAGEPDATPVACDGPEDCDSPDDPCLLPGTCEDSVCHFPQVDCSELDSECTRGVCDDEGECQARNIRQDMECGDGIMSCGAFGACGGFADMCDESGSESRSCTDSTCQSGACVTGAVYTDTRGCSRDTDFTSCGDSTSDCDGFCNYASTCDNDDTDVTCVTTDFACAAGSCASGQTTEVFDCERETEGLPCGTGGCCTPSGTCAPECF
jgi:hypothetical protein